MRAARTKTPACPAQVDLAPFCDSSGQYPALAAPWTAGGFTYASDGRVLVRIVAAPDAQTAAHPVSEPASNMFVKHPSPDPSAFEPLPASLLKVPRIIPCEKCHGSGAVLKGKLNPVLCPRCSGEKGVRNGRPVTIGPRALATHYLLLIAGLPGVRIAAQTGKFDEPLRFAFDGLLSPMDPKALKK